MWLSVLLRDGGARLREISVSRGSTVHLNNKKIEYRKFVCVIKW